MSSICREMWEPSGGQEITKMNFLSKSTFILSLFPVKVQGQVPSAPGEDVMPGRGSAKNSFHLEKRSSSASNVLFAYSSS